MTLIFGALLTAVQALSLVGVYWVLSLCLAAGLAMVLPGYGPEHALGDTQAILLIFLLWDRFYGPYSILLRGVAKQLKKAKARKGND